jgi:hypothetical protein
MVPADRYRHSLPGSFVLSMSMANEHLLLRMFAEFRYVPGKLWVFALGQALCFAPSAVVSYLGIKETALLMLS